MDIKFISTTNILNQAKFEEELEEDEVDEIETFEDIVEFQIIVFEYVDANGKQMEEEAKEEEEEEEEDEDEQNQKQKVFIVEFQRKKGSLMSFMKATNALMQHPDMNKIMLDQPLSWPEIL